jgi:thiamine biosynthesis lipoprotein ApbE/Na+-translocating ferredoxin:NAD+ oxidoreductase RnfG subunit
MFHQPIKFHATIMRILFGYILLLPVIPVLFIPSTVNAQAETEPADNFQLQTYLTEEQALNLVFPKCDEIVTDEFVLTPEEKRNLEKLLRRRLYEDGFKVYIGKSKGSVQGYAMIAEEIGKFHPFTFIVGVKPDGKIYETAVLVYRESRGGEIARKRFLYQFMGKSLKNPIRINKDIINVTGATMSVQCMCTGVRKVLSVINEYYLNGKRDVSNSKKINNDVTAGEKQKSAERTDKTQDKKSQKNTVEKRNQTPRQVKKFHKDESSSFPDVKYLKQTRLIMGTFAEISAYSNDEERTGMAIEEALDEMERMDRIMSNYKGDSQLSQLNGTAGKSPVPCGGELLDVIAQSQYYSELSGGAFDITVSPIVALWGFFHEKGHIPSREEIAKLLPAVSYKNIVINKSSDPKKPSTVFFKNTQTQIDLGAIGKGYAVDKAMEVIKKHGVDNACINLGGNIYVLGTPPGKNAWKVGVQHPRKNDEILGYLELKNEATATSGDYERFFEIHGKRYSHIIDPRTGGPVSGIFAVTVAAPTGTQVDALSTSIFVLGPEKGFELLKRVPGANALMVREGENGTITIDMTEGFKEKFKSTYKEGEDNVRWHVVASNKQ